MSLLLECGGDCDGLNSLGRTPLHLACSENQQEIAETLLRHGADVNVKDKEGVTPLMMSAKIGSAPLVETLLENGADLSPVDASKWSAADYARFTNHNQLHHRLSSLMEKSGNSGLFSNDLLNVSDESSQEEGAVALRPGVKTSDAEGAVDSWSDASEVNSIKEKPKINLTKFLHSSDESADNLASAPEPTAGLTGPPKPPRLYASSSSLASAVVDDDKEYRNNDETEDAVEAEEEEEEEIEGEDVTKADDSWKSSSEEEPQLKPLSLFPKNTEALLKGRERSLDENTANEPNSRLKKGGLLADLGLDNIEYHTSDEEDVSFDADDDMLPIEEEVKPVQGSRRTSLAFLETNDPKQSLPVESQDQADASDFTSPLHSASSPIKSKVESVERLASPPLSDQSRKSTPLVLSPKKSPSRRSPKRSRLKENKSSVYDSDTEEELSLPRPTRRKSSTPTKKKKEPHFEMTEYDVSDEDDGNDVLTSKTSPQKDASSPAKGSMSLPLEENVSDDEGKVMLNDLPSKIASDSRDKLSILMKNHGPSRTNTLSTIVGTLGREGTMQEIEEMWEANPSITPKRSSSDSSIQNSEDHSKSSSGEVPMQFSDLKVDDQRQRVDNNVNIESGGSNIQQNQGKRLPGDEGIKPSGSHDIDSKDDVNVMEDNSSDLLATSSGKILTSADVSKSPERSKSAKRNSLPEKSATLMESSKNQNLQKDEPSDEKEPKNDTNEMQSKSNDFDKTKNHSVTSTSPSRRGSRTGTGRTSGFGSIVFSDEDSIAQDPLTTPRFSEEMDDGVSAASTETEESTHINSGLKDSLLTPLSSLPDATDVGQLQDLVRELRLKLEKEFGRRTALQTRHSSLQKKDKQLRLQNSQLEQNAHHLEQEVSVLKEFC